jgi:hypothetical protein
MAPATTEARIFAERYARETRRIEKLNAGKLVPGATDWMQALTGLRDQLRAAPGPTKRAAVLRNAADRLIELQRTGERTHFVIGAYRGKKRTAQLVFMTVEFGRHPLSGVDEDGVNIMEHTLYCNRHGDIELTFGIGVAYVSRHAMQRLYERSEHDRDFNETMACLASIGMYGFMLRDNDRLADSTICLKLDNTLLATGRMWHAIGTAQNNASTVQCSIYGVSTFLDAEQIVERNKVEQGEIAMAALHKWAVDHKHSPAMRAELTDAIPFLPLRGVDFVERTAIKVGDEEAAPVSEKAWNGLK